MTATRPRWSLPALAGGAALGLGVAAAVRASALGAGNPRVPDGWINGVGLATALAALALSWLVRAPGVRRWRPSAVVAHGWGAAIAVLAVATYVGLGNDVIRYHAWEHYHYYLGAKYFPELGYRRLYACAAVAEAEHVGADAMAGRRMRDLVTDAVVPVDEALAAADACRSRFTPARWRAFGDDVMWFRAETGRVWDRMQQDHGFNPPPTWVLAGGALARLGRAGERTQALLALIDPVLLAGMFGLVVWAFGMHVAWVALVVWACQVPGQGTWTAGAFLRQDWLLWVVAAACLLRRGWPAAAGAAIASAAALRLFPAFLLGLPGLVVARRTWRHGHVARLDRRFLAGIVLAAAAWFGVTTACFGLDGWGEFREHIAVHRLAPIANHVGLRAMLSQSWEARWVAVRQPDAVDPFAVWAAARAATFAARWPFYCALAAGVVGLAALVGWRLRRLWAALAASAVLVVAAVDLASYYCAYFVVLGLLAAASRRLEWLGLGAVAASRAVNALPVAVENPDVRYTLQSLVFVVWAVLAPVLLGWRVSAGPRRERLRPTRAERRRRPA